MTIPPSFFQPNTQTLTPGSPELFKKLTGATWINAMRPGSDILPIPPIPSELELMRFLKPAYARYLVKAPLLSLHQTQTGYSVYTQEPIKRGCIVTEYLGQWSQESNKRFSSYRWGPIDALEYRNCGGMVEDGFPNIAAFHLYGIQELPLRILFVALEDIPANEMLVINYGMSHSVKINYHREYRLTSMIDYFFHHSLEDVFKSISGKRTDMDWNQNLDLENRIAKVQYLYQTPSALMQLLLKNVLSPIEVFRHFDRLDTRLNLLGFPLLPNRRQSEILHTVELLKKYFLGERLYDSFLLELIETIRMRPMIQIFLKNTLEKGSPELYRREAIILNSCLDAIVKLDRTQFTQLLDESQYKETLSEEAFVYAREVRSPASTWF
jgi:hypothetical protein